MSRTYDKYITPVMANMDSETQNHLLYRFSAIYRLNPHSMFRMKSKQSKEMMIRSFYWCVAQMYSGHNEPQIRVVANAGQGEIVQDLVKQASKIPVDSVDRWLDVFVKLAENSKVYSSFEMPYSPQQRTDNRVQPIQGICKYGLRKHPTRDVYFIENLYHLPKNIYSIKDWFMHR